MTPVHGDNKLSERTRHLTGMAFTKHQQRLRARWNKVRGCSKFAYTKYEQGKLRRENRKRRAEFEKRKDHVCPQTKLDVGNNGD